MDKLYSKKKLIADFRELQETLVAAGHPFLAGSLNSAIELVEKQPAVDAVEVVRCKDCENGRSYEDAFGQTSYECSVYRFVMDGNDFCSVGKKWGDGNA